MGQAIGQSVRKEGVTQSGYDSDGRDSGLSGSDAAVDIGLDGEVDGQVDPMLDIKSFQLPDQKKVFSGVLAFTLKLGNRVNFDSFIYQRRDVFILRCKTQNLIAGFRQRADQRQPEIEYIPGRIDRDGDFGRGVQIK